MSNFVEKAKELGGANYKKGINCAESIVITFDELCNLGIGENVRLASGFGGGIGQAGAICGALSGAIMVLGAFRGRPHPPEGERPYPLSKEFYDRFAAANEGFTDCKDLKRFESGTREQHINCLKLVVGTCELLAEYLIEKDIVKDQ